MSAHWDLEPLDITEFENGTSAAKAHFVQAFGNAFVNQGFVFLTGHQTRESTIREYYQTVADVVCGMKADDLNRYELVKDGIDRGYVSSPSGGLKPSYVALKDATGFLFVAGLKLVFKGNRVTVSDVNQSTSFILPDQIYDASNPASETVGHFQKRTLKFRCLDAKGRYAVLAPDDKHGWITGLDHNIYPGHARKFATLSQSIYNTQTTIGIQSVRTLSQFFEDKSSNLVRLVANSAGENISAHALRVYRYPGLAAELTEMEAPDSSYIRIGEHRDISLLTILAKANLPGLQIQAKDGTWHYIRSPEGSMIVMAGEMLEHMTRGLKNGAGQARSVVAPLHRVVGDSMTVTADRYTAPFFFNADLQQTILGMADQRPLVVRGVTLEPGLRLVYEHIKASTRLADMSFDNFAVDYSKLGEKIRRAIVRRGLAADAHLTS